MSRRVGDISGQKFGRLTAIQCLGAGPRRWQGFVWECICDCGTKRVISASTLKKGRARSCGCIQKEKLVLMARTQIHPNKLPDGESALNVLFRKYIQGASRRNLPFDLTKEEFRTLTKSNCKYCGAAPATVARANKAVKAVYIYNGIDRVNNTLGYNTSNCVPCCKTCNNMKHALGEAEFTQHIERIYFNLHGAKP